MVHTTKVIDIIDAKGGENEVYIGRAGHGYDGYFGNPIVRTSNCPECGKLHSTPGSTIPCFEIYFLRRLKEDREFREKVKGLIDKTLVCFCVPKHKCHGEVMVEYINRMN